MLQFRWRSLPRDLFRVRGYIGTYERTAEGEGPVGTNRSLCGAVIPKLDGLYGK